ncbi:PREDICTED: uncharacterized protein LOC106147144, partial [Chinchilla lanigera]|uniref:uncharacterized protein LOC106147144 n=1 Tax=Chinchilla lanigera TaxID=34839 RepID=UPI000698B1EA
RPAGPRGRRGGRCCCVPCAGRSGAAPRLSPWGAGGGGARRLQPASAFAPAPCRSLLRLPGVGALARPVGPAEPALPPRPARPPAGASRAAAVEAGKAGPAPPGESTSPPTVGVGLETSAERGPRTRRGTRSCSAASPCAPLLLCIYFSNDKPAPKDLARELPSRATFSSSEARTETIYLARVCASVFSCLIIGWGLLLDNRAIWEERKTPGPRVSWSECFALASSLCILKVEAELKYPRGLRVNCSPER